MKAVDLQATVASISPAVHLACINQTAQIDLFMPLELNVIITYNAHAYEWTFTETTATTRWLMTSALLGMLNTNSCDHVVASCLLLQI